MSKSHFIRGNKAMLPIITGVIPFGIVVGTVCANAGLSMLQTMTMNIIVFAGASQLASVDLMLKNAPSFIIILTGMIINLRFLLYSAALSETFKDQHIIKKIFASYTLTDQTYASLIANEDKSATIVEKVSFYFGAAIVMAFTWHISVVSGFIFGNFAPSSLSLDFAVPLSFVALVIPTLRNRNYYYVAIVSSITSVLLKDLSLNLGLLISALIGIALAAILTQQKKIND